MFINIQGLDCLQICKALKGTAGKLSKICCHRLLSKPYKYSFIVSIGIYWHLLASINVFRYVDILHPEEKVSFCNIKCEDCITSEAFVWMWINHENT